MLLKFSVENFKSYKNRNSLLLTSSSKIRTKEDHVSSLNKIDILRFAGIYGDNASGKSNIIKAMNWFKMFVGFNQIIDNSFYFIENADEDTVFDIVFSIDDEIFEYCISIRKSKNIHQLINLSYESLRLIGNGNKRSKTYFEITSNKSYFSKELDKETTTKVFINSYKDTKAVVGRAFLNYISDFDKNIIKTKTLGKLRKISEYFRNNIIVIGSDTLNIDFIEDDNLPKIEKYLKKVDLGIEGITKINLKDEDLRKYLPQPIIDDLFQKIRTNISSSKSILSVNNYSYFFLDKSENGDIKISTIEFKHRYLKTPFKFQDESDGTRRFFLLMSYFSHNNREKVFFLDEIEKSLHPNMANIVLSFFEKETKDTNTQFIFTSHQPKFMGEFLRRDEIYFAEKDNYGTSILYPLTDFKTRTNTNLTLAFLNNEFRKIPKNGEDLF